MSTTNDKMSMSELYRIGEDHSTTFCRIRENDGDTLFGMGTKQILWENLRALMVHKYGKENLSKLYKESGIGLGNLSRIKAMETAVGLEVLERIAGFFRIEPWQLLVPNLDPSNPPVVAITEAERAFYEKMKAAAKALAGLQ